MIDVYLHTSPSGRGYVGYSIKGMARRWAAHLSSARHGSKYVLHCAIRKYGERSFTHTLLERVTTEASAKRAEKLWIAELGTFSEGYNSTEGGEGTSGRKRPAHEVARMSERMRGHKPNPAQLAGLAVGRGQKPSASTLAKLRGRVFTPEHRANLSRAVKGRTFSAEHRAKLAAATSAYFARKRGKLP